MGVFPWRAWRKTAHDRLPHARGGVSHTLVLKYEYRLSSPRTWGCFHHLLLPKGQGAVFPTHVGVFLRQAVVSFILISLPHARGGVSLVPSQAQVQAWSSPRTWGCFYAVRFVLVRGKVFPTHVGVFLVDFFLPDYATGLPHARGGVSLPRQTRLER